MKQLVLLTGVVALLGMSFAEDAVNEYKVTVSGLS